MAIAPLEVKLTRLNVGTSTNPTQPPITSNISSSVTLNEPTDINVVSNDLWVRSAGIRVSSVDSLTNCVVGALPSSGGTLQVTGTSVGAASFDYTVLDGNSNSNTASVTLTVESGLGTVTVELTDVTSTSFDEVLMVGDEITYSVTTTVEGSGILVDSLGNVTLTGTYLVGDTFTYQINSGAVQIYTLG